MRRLNTTSKNIRTSVAFQYFSFDNEDLQPLTTYKNIASQLFAQVEETGDLLEHLVGFTLSPNTEKALRDFIETLITASKCTYIFLDGMDEEIHHNKRWQYAESLLSFLVQFSKSYPSRLRLWCSSQDHSVIREQLRGVTELVIDENTNGRDIEALFQHSLHDRLENPPHGVGFDLTASIDDLKHRVGGNFLWATMMLGTIDDAISITDLRHKLKKGLPENFQLYLTRQIRSLKPSPHVMYVFTVVAFFPSLTFHRRALSVMTFAKRPLTIEELCEAVEILDADPGHNIGGEGQIFARAILKRCAPLIRVHHVTVDHSSKTICTLCHGSIKEFLLQNPRILATTVDGNHPEAEITSDLIARACLKYLQQPRYNKMLRRSGNDTFITCYDEDVLEHRFLTYCARYWFQHVESHHFSGNAASHVEQFLMSPSFVTCIQVQSLFVGSKLYILDYKLK